MASVTPSILSTTDVAIHRFTPLERDCYIDQEFSLPNLKWDGGYRYSIMNCLYEGVLQMIITNCSCLPSFVEYNIKNYTICMGENLRCALDWMNHMGSSKDPDLTVANDTMDRPLKCLQRCHLQTETIMTTSSTFPNKETFLYRPEFCYVLQKISKICNNDIQKKVFLSKIEWATVCVCACVCVCLDVLEMNNTKRVCDEKDNANTGIASSNQKLVDFLFDYAAKNLAVLNIFIRDPYYTSYSKNEQISTINFIGNAGGLLGLCMGMSFVSIFEVLYHFVNNLIVKLAAFCCFSQSNNGKIIEVRS